MVVREGSNVTLQCKAKGYPEPYVMWRREDGTEMLIGGEYGECCYRNIIIWGVESETQMDKRTDSNWPLPMVE